MNSSFLHQAPVRIGSPEEFARVAQTLKDASFDEQTICETFNLKDMSDVGSLEPDDVARSALSQQFKLLARLFLYPSLVLRSEVEQILEPATIEAFISLGLLGIGEFGNNEFYARALLYPSGGFLIASDRHSTPDDSPFDPPGDIVFPAIYGGTVHFLRMMPRSPGTQALDLCGGSGIGALSLSRHHHRAVSADITERATQFAQFNQALNNCRNVEVTCGDLYAPVAGQTFDCITAHPPYVPSIGVETIWRDGGATGELLVKRIIEGVPSHLAPGGVFCCQMQAVDTQEGRFEERARGWLGDRRDEFDIIFAVADERSPTEVLETLTRKLSGDAVKQALQREFQRAGVLKMPFGVLFMRRAKDATGHKPWTSRRAMSDQTVGQDVEAAFVLHDRLSAPGFHAKLSECSPRLAPRLQVKVTHVVHENQLVAADFVLEIDKPFATFLRFEPWMVSLLAALDGRKTLREIYEKAKNEASIPDEFKLENFVILVERTLEAGYVLLD